MPPVTSTAADRVEYDAGARILDIWFKGGDRYSYFDVPPGVYEALLEASSIGAFVNARIKPFHRCQIEQSRRRFRPD